MPDDFLRKQWLRYQGEIASMDGRIGELLNEIDGMGIADDTVVVLVADHGESFEHEYYFAHGSRLYDPLVHVPLMIRSPGRLAPRRVSAQVRLIDLCPTLLALIGAEGGPACQGEDFSGLARGTVCDEPAADRIAVCQTDFEIVWPVVPKEQIAVRTPAWKYIESPTTGRVELYDLAADPAEVDDRAAQEVAVRDELESLLREWDATTESTDVSVESLTSQQTEALRALGYLREWSSSGDVRGTQGAGVPPVVGLERGSAVRCARVGSPRGARRVDAPRGVRRRRPTTNRNVRASATGSHERTLRLPAPRRRSESRPPTIAAT